MNEDLTLKYSLFVFFLWFQRMDWIHSLQKEGSTDFFTVCVWCLCALVWYSYYCEIKRYNLWGKLPPTGTKGERFIFFWFERPLNLSSGVPLKATAWLFVLVLLYNEVASSALSVSAMQSRTFPLTLHRLQQEQPWIFDWIRVRKVRFLHCLSFLWPHYPHSIINTVHWEWPCTRGWTEQSRSTSIYLKNLTMVVSRLKKGYWSSSLVLCVLCVCVAGSSVCQSVRMSLGSAVRSSHKHNTRKKFNMDPVNFSKEEKEDPF